MLTGSTPTQTSKIIAMTRLPAKDPFVVHMDEHWPVPAQKSARLAVLEKCQDGLAVLETCQTGPETCPAGETAVTRALQMGRRLIPDGPRAEQFVDHRLWLCRASADHAVLATTDLYDEYVTMCDLGGWKPLGKQVLFSRLETLGYPRRRVSLPSGDRAWVFDFSIPPEK